MADPEIGPLTELEQLIFDEMDRRYAAALDQAADEWWAENVGDLTNWKPTGLLASLPVDKVERSPRGREHSD